MITIERHPLEDRVADEVREGLTRELRELPPKLFYDERGSELFDRITTLPEYYPTRCERWILNRHARAIVAGMHELVELGSGTASKTRALLYAMASAGSLHRYLPLDVDSSVIEACAEELVEIYPGLVVHGVVGDFHRDMDRLPDPAGPRLYAFLGGTIGNLYPDERRDFLLRLAGLMRPGDRLLLGTDLVKDRAVLEAAYDDRQGVTAEFNRNILRVVNAGLRADFDPDAFEHVAFFDDERSWVEMRLRADGTQRVTIEACDLELELADGEEIRTEISTKFSRHSVERELRSSGLELERFLTDDAEMFGLAVSVPRP